MAITIAVTNQPHPSLASAPGTAATKLAPQISAIAQLFISTTSKPAK